MHSRLPYRGLAVLLLFVFALTLRAQQQTIVLGQSAVPLTGPWKFQPGDSPWVSDPSGTASNGHFLWADPAFDDSRWASMDLTPTKPVDIQTGIAGYTPGWTSRGYPRLHGYAWYRLRLHVQNAGQPLSIEMPMDVDDAFQVFVNGRYLGQFGRFHAHTATLFYSQAVTFPIPSPPSGADLEIAVRMFMSDVSALRWPDAGGLHAPPLLGLTPAIARQAYTDTSTWMLSITLGDFLCMLLCLLPLPFAVWAAFRMREDGVWLWLALALACHAAGSAAQAWGDYSPNASMWFGEFWFLCVFAPAIEFCWTMFWWQWFGLRNRRWIAGAASLLSIGSFLTLFVLESPLLEFTFASQGLLHASSVAIVVFHGAMGLLLLVILVEGYRRDRTAALLATIPILLLEFASFYAPLLVTFHFSPQFYFGPVGLSYSALSAIFLILIVGALCVRRFLSTRDQEIAERESVARDLEQARQLQQSVLVAEAVRSAAYSVDVEYHPAQTVGGDFFLTVTQPDGSLLLIIGDVSGKGISAAMLVAVLVGAARASARQTSDPAAILAELNAQLIGRSGGHFATCLIAALTPAGELRLANAGHLPPYRNGREVELEGSLPLGMTAVLEPATLTVTLSPGDTLTFLSDGVVEARPRGPTLWIRPRPLDQHPVRRADRRRRPGPRPVRRHHRPHPAVRTR
ncbi:MAG TPA: PP2C family protein-serine/threonine phosphatase [Acidobacteriaceae bacterium]|nr:PP2C family protein-serine/threonine phosphatase [Acidobacteriaceae bacterium]